MEVEIDRRQVLTAATLLGAGRLLSPGRAWGGGAASHWTTGSANEELEQLDWFLDARFGLFVHWGPYSVAGVEASWPIMVPALTDLIGPDQRISEADYTALAERFDPKGFDAREWVRFVREAGMRYLVITAKHHDGYCMFDAPGRSYKITRSPYGRDILAELAEACAAADLPLGFYYSPPDMHHPGYRDTSRPVVENWLGEPDRPQWSEYLDAMEADLRKLLTDYGDVAIVWFDGLFEYERYSPERFHRLVRELQPRALINDRLGADLADYITPEQNVPPGIPVRRETPAPEITAEEFARFMKLLTSGASPEDMARMLGQAQRARMPTELDPAVERFQPWETCMTLGVSWGYDPQDRQLKSAEEVVRTLIEVVSRGGNLLLNVGPTPQGTFPESARQRLQAVGRWLEKNGDAIYETTWGPLQGLEQLRSTRSRPKEEKGDDRVFLHLFSRPSEGPLLIEGAGTLLASEVAAPARLLPGQTHLPIEVRDDDAVIQLSALPDVVEGEVDLPVLELRSGAE